MEAHYRYYSQNCIVTFHKATMTRWDSKLNILEKYNILKPIFEGVLPAKDPNLLDEGEDCFVTACIDVLREVSGIIKKLERHKKSSSSKTLSLVMDLFETLKLVSSNSTTFGTVLSSLAPLRKSSTNYDNKTTANHKRFYDSQKTQILAEYFTKRFMGKWDIFVRLQRPPELCGALKLWARPNKRGIVRQNKLGCFNALPSFDIKRCGLDWQPLPSHRVAESSFLSNVDKISVIINSKLQAPSTREKHDKKTEYDLLSKGFARKSPPLLIKKIRPFFHPKKKAEENGSLHFEQKSWLMFSQKK